MCVGGCAYVWMSMCLCVCVFICESGCVCVYLCMYVFISTRARAFLRIPNHHLTALLYHYAEPCLPTPPPPPSTLRPDHKAACANIRTAKGNRVMVKWWWWGRGGDGDDALHLSPSGKGRGEDVGGVWRLFAPHKRWFFSLSFVSCGLAVPDSLSSLITETIRTLRWCPSGCLSALLVNFF